MAKAVTILCVLLALQGVVGLDEYQTHSPTGFVWVHVGLASLGAWLTTIWAVCAAGRCSRAPRRSRPSARRAARS